MVRLRTYFSIQHMSNVPKNKTNTPNETGILNSFRSFLVAINKKNYVNWTCFDTKSALEFLLDNIFVRFGNSVYRQVIGNSNGD